MITLSSATMQELSHVATSQDVPIDDLAERAVQQFLRQLEREKIKTEAQAYRDQHAALVEQYLGQYIALHEGHVVDYDEAFQPLHQRVRQRFGRQAVLIRQVTPTPERVLTVRSPRLERRL